MASEEVIANCTPKLPAYIGLGCSDLRVKLRNSPAPVPQSNDFVRKGTRFRRRLPMFSDNCVETSIATNAKRARSVGPGRPEIASTRGGLTTCPAPRF